MNTSGNSGLSNNAGTANSYKGISSVIKANAEKKSTVTESVRKNEVEDGYCPFADFAKQWKSQHREG